MAHELDPETLRAEVRRHYGRAATRSGGCCGSDRPSCGSDDAREAARVVGYEPAELDAVPEGAVLGLGCGNPTAVAALAPGEVVVDLGSGGGIDCFLAATRVGPTGRVIGVDMTPEMLALSRRQAVEAGVAGHVEFREGTIEDLPIVSGSADVVLSNCVINLSADKLRVFREAFRVLRAGGRLAVSDIVLSEPLPEAVAGLAAARVGCLGGAMLADDYLGAIREAGFVDVRWTRTPAADLFDGIARDPEIAATVAALGPDLVARVAGTVWSYRIEARKP